MLRRVFLASESRRFSISAGRRSASMIVSNLLYMYSLPWIDVKLRHADFELRSALTQQTVRRIVVPTLPRFRLPSGLGPCVLAGARQKGHSRVRTGFRRLIPVLPIRSANGDLVTHSLLSWRAAVVGAAVTMSLPSALAAQGPTAQDMLRDN